MSGLSLKAKKKEAAVDMILKAAEELWLKDDYLEPSMASLAKHAGIAVGTLYNYFSDQEALTTAWFKVAWNKSTKPSLKN